MQQLLQNISQYCIDQKLPCNMYLSGSYGRNEQRIKQKCNNSDIDILVVVDDVQNIEKITRVLDKINDENELSFIFCLKSRLEMNPTRNFVLSTNFKNPIYETFTLHFDNILRNKEMRVNSQLQGVVYLVGKYVRECKIVDLYKSFFDALKTLILLEEDEINYNFILLKDLLNHRKVIDKYFDYDRLHIMLQSYEVNTNYSWYEENLLFEIEKLFECILRLMKEKNIPVLLDSINYFIMNNLIHIHENSKKPYYTIKELVHYENLGISGKKTIEKNDVGKNMRVYTLGPQGTDSERAAKHWIRNIGINVSIHLFATFNDALNTMSENDCLIMPLGFSDRREGANCKSWVDFHFMNYEKLNIIDIFRLKTKPMVLLENKDYVHNDAVIHSSVYQLLNSYFDDINANISFCNSKMEAFEKFDMDKHRYTLVSKDCLFKGNQRFTVLKSFEPEMIWVVYQKKEVEYGR